MLTDLCKDMFTVIKKPITLLKQHGVCVHAIKGPSVRKAGNDSGFAQLISPCRTEHVHGGEASSKRQARLAAASQGEMLF